MEYPTALEASTEPEVLKITTPMLLPPQQLVQRLLRRGTSDIKGAALQGLREHADDPAFQEKWQEVKQTAKTKAVDRIAQITGVEIPQHALLDIQVPLPGACMHAKSP